MNSQNPNLQTPNGQQQGQQQLQQQQQQVNLGHPSEVPNASWRNEVTVPDRTRFVSQL